MMTNGMTLFCQGHVLVLLEYPPLTVPETTKPVVLESASLPRVCAAKVPSGGTAVSGSFREVGLSFVRPVFVAACGRL
jgi:hypothetical protein